MSVTREVYGLPNTGPFSICHFKTFLILKDLREGGVNAIDEKGWKQFVYFLFIMIRYKVYVMSSTQELV